MTYDVFISFKNSGKDGRATPDAAAARKVYQALRDIGLKVFFSEESLAEVGKGQFAKAIEHALEASRVLVLVASCREHVESPWVEAEWDSFSQDIRSGNKQGELFIYNCGDLKPATLPLFLRRQQMFPEAGLDKLVKFVKSAVPSIPTLADFVQLSLHCFHPEKNEDKVYLVTVQQGTGDGAFNVTAHWGARSAKRLSSQLKAINVQHEAAQAEIEKAKQEKLRGGYAPASHFGLLSNEAESYLAASLGLMVVAATPAAEAPPQPEAPSAPTKKTKSTKPVAEVPDPTPVATKDIAKGKPPAKGKAVPAKSPVASVPVKAVEAEALPTAKSKGVKPAGKQKTEAVTEPAMAVPAKKAVAPAKPAKAAATVAAAAPKVVAAKPSAKAAAKPVTKGKPAVVPTPVEAPAEAMQTVCISGKLPSGKKKADYEAPLRKAGYELVDDVVKGLAYLVVADPTVPTAKSEKARKQGVKLLSEDGLIKLVK